MTLTAELPLALEGRDFFAIDPDDCALLVIDMQNAFIEPGAAYECQNGRAIIPNLNKLVAAARKKKIPVLWTQSDHSPPVGGLLLDRHPHIKQRHVLWKDTHSYDLYTAPAEPGGNQPEMVQPADGDHVIVKHKFDCFYGTDLEIRLRNLGRRTLIIAGVATEICCETTARSAYVQDYKVVFMRDVTAALNPANHDKTCDLMDMMFGRTLAADRLLDIFAHGDR